MSVMSIRKVLVVTCILILALIVSCGTANDPMLDDMYTRNIYPGANSTHDIGSTTLQYQDGYFTNLYLSGIPVTSGEISPNLFDAATFLYATNDNDPQPKTPAEVMTILSGQAGGTFDWNGQNLTNLGDLTILGSFISSGGGQTGKFLTGLAGNTVFSFSGNNFDIRAGSGSSSSQNVMRVTSTGDFGIGTNNPDTKLEILNAGNQLKLSFDGTDNVIFAVDTNGVLTITPSGAAVDFASKNLTGLGTLSAFTLGGTMDVNSQALINILDLDLGTESAMGTFSATLTAANAGTAWVIKSKDTSDIHRARLGLSGGVDTAVWSWVNSTHTGIALSGDIAAGGNAITGHAQAVTDNAVLTVDGSPNDNEYVKFTAIGLEGKTYAELLADLLTTGDLVEIQVDMDYSTIRALGKPTDIHRGIFNGFSLPVYSNDNEEIFLKVHIPHSWDGATDFVVKVYGYIDTANDTKNFQLRLQWENVTPGTDVYPATDNDVDIETATGGSASQYQSYEINFTIDYNIDDPANIARGDVLGLLLQRIAANSNEITGEFVVTDVKMQYKRSLLGG